MNILIKSLRCSNWFCFIAVVASLYYGIRGIIIERWTMGSNDPSRIQIFVAYPWAFTLNFSGSAAGFIALFLIYRICSPLDRLLQIGTGTGMYLIFLSIITFTGITGILPEMIMRKDLFKIKT